MVIGAALRWTPVTSRLSQRLALSSLLFIIYVNDINDGLVPRISKLNDDIKYCSDVASNESAEASTRPLSDGRIVL